MDRILGQPRVIDALQTQLASGRLHHAYIFHGPPGVGKFTTATAFARVLLCHQQQTDLTGRVTACGTCEACRLFDAGTHPDFHPVTKELARFSDDRATRERKLITIPAELLRDALIEPVYRAAQLRHGKVFVVDEAELLNPTGQNLLLKTLEEPPAGTYLILVTSSEDRLLPTIRSRCQRLGFAPLPDDVVESWLERQAGDAVSRLNATERSWLIEFAAGSLGRAQLALDYGLTQWAEAVLPQVEVMSRGRFDPTLGSTMATCIDEFAKAWVSHHDNASKDAANKQGAALMWLMLSQFARRRLKDESRRCDAADPIAAERQLEPWLGVIEALNQAEAELAANVNLGLVCDHLVSMLQRRLTGASAAGV